MEENDLPLLSNIHEWRARHYLMKFILDIPNKTILCDVVIFIDRPSPCELEGKFCYGSCCCKKQKIVPDSNYKHCNEAKCNSKVILESCDIEIHSISELQSNFEELPSKLSEFGSIDFWLKEPIERLQFIQDKWSLTVFIGNNKKDCRVILLNYKTREHGSSVYWREDVNKNLCCFTPGALINNRSLLPGQDRPVAMATWQAWVVVPSEYYVAMTGDERPKIKQLASDQELNGSTGSFTFYYFTTMILPISTIALAAGKWKVKHIVRTIDDNSAEKMGISNKHNEYCHHENYPCYLDGEDRGPIIPFTFLAPEIYLENANHLFEFVKFSLKASYAILGRHPFKRLELVILPRCFANLGLASPNLLFISKTLLENDSSSNIRISHEISHSWFGISIGAKDWREEWLSEGFATYLEDLIYAVAIEMQNVEESGSEILEKLDKYQNLFDLRAYIRSRTLVSEMENTDNNLKIVSPCYAFNTFVPFENIQEVRPIEASVSTSYNFNNIPVHSDEEQATVDNIINGISSDKPFLQMHYLKGYFFLLCLEKLFNCCRPKFLNFLKKYCLIFHGQLVTSQDFLDLFFKEFPHIEQTAIRKTFSKWLGNNFEDFKTSFIDLENENVLISCIQKHIEYWNDLIINKSCSGILSKEKKLILLCDFRITYSDQLVLLMEWLLEKESISPQILKGIATFYKITNRNADVRHRWCELVIKHNYSDFQSIEEFLTEEQSMGVYLYGELMISNKTRHKQLAKKMLRKLNDELDCNAKTVIKSMVCRN